MYALFFDDSKDLIGFFDTKSKAMAMGKLMSQEGPRPILCIYNKGCGGTSVCFKFENGGQTFDGGRCPNEPPLAAAGA